MAKKSGISLMEEVVVVAIIAMFVVLGVPAIRAFVKSFESGSSARAMISASLSSARAIAAKEQHYAGIRFQNKYQADGKGCQYMIFIIHDPEKTKLANGFRAVEGVEPIKLPDSVGVMDLKLGSTTPPDQIVNSDNNINDDWEVSDTTSFSIVFSPSGKLVIHDVQVRNRDGKIESTETATVSQDDIFNTKTKIGNGIGMFVQDDYPSEGFDKEPSRNSFVIYDRKLFEKLASGSRFTGYLKYLADNEVVYINPYTGTMINK